MRRSLRNEAPMDWNDNLPDTTTWQPESKKQDTLTDALMTTCQIAQMRIVARAKAEIAFNIHNFDSGPGVEDIVRDELANLLPRRYSVDTGVVNDRDGNTAGDCDIVVRDPLWSPIIKLGATRESRRFHFPIEGIYAVAEVKQTLGFEQLDDAMKKLVTISRLNRPDNPYGHITENQHLEFLDRRGAILNPLHCTVFATRLRDEQMFGDLVRRFGAINASLSRNDMVNMLCILDHGTAWYSVESGSPFNATYMTDRDQPLIMQLNDGDPVNAFYRFYVELYGHLNRSVLRSHDLSATYGKPPPPRHTIKYDAATFNKLMS